MYIEMMRPKTYSMAGQVDIFESHGCSRQEQIEKDDIYENAAAA